MLAIPLSYLLGGHRLQRRQQVADQAADTDALTGLSGCRPFRPTLEAALTSARNPGREVALALIDIDEFKQVNDRLGRNCGVRGTLCASDTAFRLETSSRGPAPPRTDEQALEVIECVRASFTEHAPGVSHLQLRRSRNGAPKTPLRCRSSGNAPTPPSTRPSAVAALTISVDKLDAVRSLLDPATVLTRQHPAGRCRPGRPDTAHPLTSERDKRWALRVHPSAV